MGARIIVCDPHRVVVDGPAQLLRPAADEPRHPRRDGDRDRGALRRGHLADRQRRRDRPRLRADRRAPARARRANRARRLPSACTLAARRRSAIGVDGRGRGRRRSTTGLPRARPAARAARRGGALRPRARGRARRAPRRRSPPPAGRSAPRSPAPLRADGARGYGSGAMIAGDEALAGVVLEVAGRAARRLERRLLTRGSHRRARHRRGRARSSSGSRTSAGLVLHVRLLERHRDPSTCSRRSSRRSAPRSAQACRPDPKETEVA